MKLFSDRLEVSRNDCVSSDIFEQVRFEIPKLFSDILIHKKQWSTTKTNKFKDKLNFLVSQFNVAQNSWKRK